MGEGPRNAPTPPFHAATPQPHQVVADAVPQHVELHQAQFAVAVFLRVGGLRKLGGLGFFGGFWGCHPPWGRGCPPQNRGGGGYVHEVDHAAARLSAEAFGAQVFICKEPRGR